MGISQNSIDKSDISTYPIKVVYTASYTSASLSNYGITINKGINAPYSISGSYFLNYKLAKQLYYNGYLTGSLLISSSAWNDNLQSTAASGTFDDDYRYFPTESDSNINIISIPSNIFGEKIGCYSFKISSSTYNIIDDGNGNIIDSINNNTHVGNILYSQGLAVITNQDYARINNPNTKIIYYSRSLLTNRIITPGGADIGNYYDDIVTSGISIGFNFVFYGSTYNTVNLSSNGNLQFLTNNTDYYINQMPKSSLSASIMPLFSDLYLDRVSRSDSGIYVQTIGSAPNRIFCAEWKGVAFGNSYTKVNFQIKLYETTNNIELLYGQISQGLYNCVGIQKDGVSEYFDQFYIGYEIPVASGSSILYTSLV